MLPRQLLPLLGANVEVTNSKSGNASRDLMVDEPELVTELEARLTGDVTMVVAAPPPSLLTPVEVINFLISVSTFSVLPSEGTSTNCSLRLPL